MIRRKTTNNQPYPLQDKLHTDILEEKYGKISVEVLYDDDKVREVLLCDKLGITRTYAITVRTNEWRDDEAVCEVNAAIRNGEPIGKAFKERGYTIVKNVLAVYSVEAPAWLQKAFATEEKLVKARTTEFIVIKTGIRYCYGYVTEFYSPDFRKAVVAASDLDQMKSQY